jgi:DNA-binding NtrC family response regulator
MAASEGPDSITIAIGTPLHEADRALILATLAYCRGVRKRTAAMLGISLKTLYNRLVAYRAIRRTDHDPARQHPQLE